MILLLRALVRLLAFALLAALAVAGIAVAVFCIGGGRSGLSLLHGAELLHLPQFRDSVGSFLTTLEAGGPVAVVAALAGLGAMLLGVLLLAGALVPRRERLVSAGDGVAARRRPLAQMAAALAEGSDGVTAVRARVRPGRRGGGRLKIRAERTLPAHAADVERAIAQATAPLAEPFGLTTRVRTRVGRGGARVE